MLSPHHTCPFISFFLAHPLLYIYKRIYVLISHPSSPPPIAIVAASSKLARVCLFGGSGLYPFPGTGNSEMGVQAAKVNSAVKAKANGGNDEQVDYDFDFDSSAPPPFKMADVRAAIPPHCWVKNPWRSLSYVVKDLIVVSLLAALAVYVDHWAFWPVYWAAQGTMFWALFVLGHDCGHGSFSDSLTLNSVVGHILHSLILVPYHGWRISHRTHHQNHGNVEKDESWVPMSKNIYNTLNLSTKFLRFKIPFPLFAYPIYLVWRSPGKSGSHFNPYSDLFHPTERKQIVVSTLCWSLMFAILVYLSMTVGFAQVVKVYGVPYMTFVAWLDFVTYLHHHGHEQKLPWYRGKEWTYLRGGLTTIDRDYGMLNSIHHDIGTHVIHHLFPQMPHYHLVEATKSSKHVLGKYYREPKSSGFLPFHLFGELSRSIKEDHYVNDDGDVVYYQTDPSLYGFPEPTKTK